MDEQELQAIMEKLRNGVELTNEEMIKLSQSAGNSSKALNAMNSTLASLGRGVVNVAKQMTDGAKGASVYNSAISDTTDAVSKVAGQFGILGKGLGLLVQAIGGYVQAVNQLSDNLYNTYSKLSKTGVTAADGMTGLKDAAVSLGYGLSQIGLEQFAGLMSKASHDLALMTGSAADGRKQLARFGGLLADRGPVQRAFGNLGYQVEDLAEMSAGYIKQEVAMGRGKQRTDKDLAQSTQEYIKQLDILAKLTGKSVEEVQGQMDADLRNERFQAAVMKVERTQGKAAADSLRQNMAVASLMFPDLADGLKDLAGGFTDTQAAARVFRSGMGNVVNLMTQDNASWMNEMSRAAKKTTNSFGETLGAVGVFSDVFGSLNEQVKLGTMSERDANEIRQKLIEAQKKILAGQDPALDEATKLRIEQMKGRDTMQGLLTIGILPVTNAMANLAQIMNGLLAPFNAIAGMFGYKPPGAPAASTTEKVAGGATLGATLMGGAAIAAAPFTGGASLAALPLLMGAGAVTGGAMAAMGSGSTADAGASASKMSQKDLAAMGLRIKQGDVQADNATIHPSTLALAQKVQSSIDGFNYFSGFNDRYHQENSPSSTHTSGKSFDFTLGFKPTSEQGKAIASQLRAMGAINVIDEYNNPSSKSTGGHFHVQALAKGGIATGPRSGYMAQLHGNEAVVPLPDNRSIPVDMPNFSDGFDRQSGILSQQLMKMEELISLIRAQNATSERILQVQSN